MKKLFNTDFPREGGHLALLIFRVAGAAFMLTHGIPKLSKLISGDEIQFADPYGLGPVASFALVVLAEFAGSILVILGLGTRIAAIFLVIDMLTAGFYAHAQDPFSVKEKAFLYLIVFGLILVFGPGHYSIDRLLGRKTV